MLSLLRGFLQRVVQQANSVRIAGQLKTMATADVAASGWDRERIASQLQPLLVLWQTTTSGNSALKAVSHGVSTGCQCERDASASISLRHAAKHFRCRLKDAEKQEVWACGVASVPPALPHSVRMPSPSLVSVSLSNLQPTLAPLFELSAPNTLSEHTTGVLRLQMVVEKAAPVDAFVAMESEAALKLVNMVASALSSAQRVFAGSDLLTTEVKAVTTSLAAGKVPRPWDSKWEGPDSPALWLQVAALCVLTTRISLGRGRRGLLPLQAGACSLSPCQCITRESASCPLMRLPNKSLCSCTCAQCICLTGGGEEKAGYRRVAGKRAKWGDTVAANLARRNLQPTSLSQRTPPANVAKFAAAGGCGRSQTGVCVGRVSGAINGHSSVCLVRPLSAGRSLYGRRNPQRCSRRHPNGHASKPCPTTKAT
jgi:hypothetical protein